MNCDHDFKIDWHIFKNGTKHLRGICCKCGAKRHFPQTPENLSGLKREKNNEET